MAQQEKKRVKRPTAAKRLIQDNKKRLRNRILKSQIRTSIRSFINAENDGEKQECIKLVYSLVDKAVKKGIYKKNKGARVKSRLLQAS